MTTPETPHAAWRPSTTFVTGAVAGVVLLALGVFAGRPDVALLGAGPVLAAAWSARRGGTGPVSASEDIELDKNGTMSAERLAASYRVEAPGSGHLRVQVSRFGSLAVEALVAMDDDGGRTLIASTSSARNGAQPLFTFDHVAVGPAGSTVAEPGRLDATRIVALPRARRLPPLPLPFRLRGLTGAHASRRPGDGGELRDVHQFQPGDRLKRIDWRVTARRSPQLDELYVRRDFALADSVVVVVLDSRDDVGPDAATWSGAQPVRPDEHTSLDIAREAAASLATTLVNAGDRVALRDLADARRPIEPGTGRRHLDRFMWHLATTSPRGAATERVRAPQLPSGALVVLLSTFLDPHSALVARQWRRVGHRVIAIDTLPPLRTDSLTSRERLAVRLVTIERTDRLAELAGFGVEAFAWVPTPGADRPAGPEVQLMRLAYRSHAQPGKQAGR
ncbi:MAG: DUF58 domain-containing protein [Actinomycetales bacterium]|nr:DUF58 domain-containing protein [Actinomycetales bacterium]